MKTSLQKTLLTLLGLGLVLWPVNSLAVTVSPYQSQKDKLNAQMQAAKEKAAAKAQQAADFQDQISSISASIDKIEQSLSNTNSKITDTENVINSLSNQIKIAEDNIAREKVKMGQILAAWYMQGDSGLLESLLGSDNVSEVIDVQEQYDSLKQQVSADIDKITADELALTNQKNDQLAKKQELSELKTQQVSQKRASETDKNRKNNLLNMTLAQQQQYLDSAKKAQAEITKVTAEEAAWRAAQDAKSNARITTGGTGGYPYGNSNALDPWLFYQLQCTSYAAWYWNSRGHNWYNTQPGRGDARYWNEIAATLGYATGSSPQVGAIISWKSLGVHGHVAIVQKVNGDGTIDVSEYNWIAYSYSYRANVNPGIYGSYVYIYP